MTLGPQKLRHPEPSTQHPASSIQHEEPKSMIGITAPSGKSGLSVATPIARPGQRIGVMGGSFNPPHEGHLTVAETAARRLRLDRVWWLVSPGNPLKDHDHLAPLEERINAIKNLTSDPRMVVTAFEQQLDTPYTAATLGFLKNRYRATPFVWVMGADNLATFHLWQRWRDIFATMPIAVVDRPGWHLKALSSPAAIPMANARVPEASAHSLPGLKPPAWTYLTTRLSPLSSTVLRAGGAGLVQK